MKELSNVFSSKLVEIVCYRGLTANHNEQEEAHRGRKIMKSIDGHSKGSEVIHMKLSDEEVDMDIATTKVQLEVMR